MARDTAKPKRKDSRAKGKRGELELAHWLTERGFPARRGQQFRGGSGSPDIICEGLPNWHWEVKRVERLELYKSLAQAIRDANGRIPLVAHRMNGQEWVVVMRLEDVLGMFAF